MPTVRGWLALLAACFCFFFPWTWPIISIQSALRFRYISPVPPWVWFTGGALVIIGGAISVHAFVRGSRPDKIVACLAALVVLLLSVQMFDLVVLAYRSRATNHRSAADAGLALWFQVGGIRSRAADSGRWQ
jgi:hypothetical protein